MQILRLIPLILFLAFYNKVSLQTLNSHSPNSLNAKLGLEFNIVISVENVIDLFGVSFILEFDNFYIESIGTTYETFLGDDVVYFPTIENNEGKVSVGVTRKYGQGNVSGTGEIVKIRFRIINVPSSNDTLNFHLIQRGYCESISMD